MNYRLQLMSGATRRTWAPEGDGTGSLSGDGGGQTDAGGGGGETVAGAAGGDTVAGAGGQDTLAGAGGNDAIDPAAAEREAARAVKPDKAEAFALNFSEAAAKALGDVKDDPVVRDLRDHALAKGWTQGEFDDRVAEVVNLLAEKGHLQPVFDPAAETAKLGQNGRGRQEDVQTFAKNLLDRKEITAEEYEDMMSLVPTATGTTLIEKLRKMMGSQGEIITAGTPAETPDARKARAAEMRRDPRYDTDPAWKKQTDELRMSAYGKR